MARKSAEGFMTKVKEEFHCKTSKKRDMTFQILQ
jgi:hypothetical protein